MMKLLTNKINNQLPLVKKGSDFKYDIMEAIKLKFVERVNSIIPADIMQHIDDLVTLTTKTLDPLLWDETASLVIAKLNDMRIVTAGHSIMGGVFMADVKSHINEIESGNTYLVTKQSDINYGHN